MMPQSLALRSRIVGLFCLYSKSLLPLEVSLSDASGSCTEVARRSGSRGERRRTTATTPSAASVAPSSNAALTTPRAPASPSAPRSARAASRAAAHAGASSPLARRRGARTEFLSLLEPYGAEPEITGFRRTEDGAILITAPSWTDTIRFTPTGVEYARQ